MKFLLLLQEKFKTIILIIVILFIALFLSYVLNLCRIRPWRKVDFYSCDEYMELDEIKGFERLTRLYPESVCNGVFLYTVTHAYGETMYVSNNPYAFVFVFYHYTPGIAIKINSIKITNENNENLPIYMKFPIEVVTDNFENYKNLQTKEIYKSSYLTGQYITEYAYKIKNNKFFTIEINVEVDNNGKKEEKIITQRLNKRVEKGIIQYGF